MTARKISTTSSLLWIFCVALSAALEPGNAVYVTSTTEAGLTDAAPNLPSKAAQKPLTARAKAADEGRTIVAIGSSELDGRSAYINNQYVEDKETLTYNDNAPPLYQILQQHMEHILGSSGVPDEYRLENKVMNSETMTDGATASAVHEEVDAYDPPALQSATKSPIFAYGVTNFEAAIEDDLVSNYRKDEKQKYYEGTASTKPSTMELPKPIVLGAKKEQSVDMRPQLPITTTTTTSTTTTTQAPNHPAGGYGAGLAESALQPAATSTQQNKSQPLLTDSYASPMPSYKPQIMEENSTVHLRKRRITFKTVASTSQIISTPLADLMFKYSISVAKPSMLEGGGQNVEQMQNSVTTGYVDNLDLRKRMYADKTSHSSYRKNA